MFNSAKTPSQAMPSPGVNRGHTRGPTIDIKAKIANKLIIKLELVVAVCFSFSANKPFKAFYLAALACFLRYAKTDFFVPRPLPLSFLIFLSLVFV